MPPRIDVGLYLIVDVDPVEDNLIALGYLRSERGEARHSVEILPDGRPKLESESLCKRFGALLDDLAEIDCHNAENEDSPERQIQAHIFLYEPSEAFGLQEAVARHLENPLVRTGLLHLIRMFPPEDIVPEPEFRGIHHLPATALRSVIEQLFALPIMVSYDLHQVTQTLAKASPGFAVPYSPNPPFKRPFSSRLSIDVCRDLRDGRTGIDPIREDVVARLNAMCALAEWLMRENAVALQREGDHAFLRLNKRPFRFQQTLDPLNAVDLDVLHAFELLENRAGMLDAIQAKVARYLPAPPDVLYLGDSPAGSLDPSIQHIPFRSRHAIDQVWENLENDYLIAGCSVWALNRVLNAGGGDKPDGPTSPLFQLVCIDEASQMVISNGLMALAGLDDGGRVLVAGDDKQLPPVRAVHALEIDGRCLGGSLYDFLKSAEVAEFPLEETFRLNAPLTRFPETKFYPGRYRSAAASAGNLLELPDGWDQGLESWERAALDPRYPLCVLLHDGPTAGTSNPFEVAIASRLVRRLCRAMQSETADGSELEEAIWQDRLAVISPHRAQNAAIRAALANDPAGNGAVVETVDKIQGKERDAIIASYTVSDPEFALAEAEFIVSIERLNVTITRARTKLILIVSRRLLDVVPPDESTLDAARVLRELVFDSQEVGTIHLTDSTGRKVPVNLRVRGFTEGGELPPLIDTPQETDAEPLPELTQDLEEILSAIRELGVISRYGTAADFAIQKKLFRATPVPFVRLRDLVRLGQRTPVGSGLRGPQPPRRSGNSSHKLRDHRRLDLPARLGRGHRCPARPSLGRSAPPADPRPPSHGRGGPHPQPDGGACPRGALRQATLRRGRRRPTTLSGSIPQSRGAQPREAGTRPATVRCYSEAQ